MDYEVIAVKYHALKKAGVNVTREYKRVSNHPDGYGVMLAKDSKIDGWADIWGEDFCQAVLMAWGWAKANGLV